jgi:hypothetical protein
MKNPQATVDSIFKQVEAELSLRLLKQDFLLESQVYSDEAFGSQYTEWRNQYESYALRLVWDGKERWFVIQESPFSRTSKPHSWTDVLLVPFDKTKITEDYTSSIVRDLLKEVG